jgi:hypothetical protein
MEKNPPRNPPVDMAKKDRLAQLKKFMRKRPPKKRLMIVTGVSTIILLMGIVGLALFGPKAPEPEPVSDITSTYVPPPTTLASPLTGVQVQKVLAERPVTGIIIENSVDARPHSGLIDAGIVFEAIAEGGITRFLALYQESQPGSIGPIRSARPYFVRWVAGFDASFVHVGGSPEGLALIRDLGVKDLDQTGLGDRIASRVSSRYAPHNMYTDMDRIDAMNTERGYTASDFKPFTRKEDTPSTSESPPTASSIQFSISGANYNTSYTYDSTSNSYKRVMAGIPHTDQVSRTQISPKVVIGLVMGYSIHPNGIHSIYDNIGSGEAVIFQDGKIIQANWRKSSDKAALELLDARGEPIALNAGQTWITAVQRGNINYVP